MVLSKPVYYGMYIMFSWESRNLPETPITEMGSLILASACKEDHRAARVGAREGSSQNNLRPEVPF